MFSSDIGNRTTGYESTIDPTVNEYGELSPETNVFVLTSLANYYGMRVVSYGAITCNDHLEVSIEFEVQNGTKFQYPETVMWVDNNNRYLCETVIECLGALGNYQRRRNETVVRAALSETSIAELVIAPEAISELQDHPVAA